MPSLDQLLSRVVARKGYTIVGADSEGLLARKGEESLLVAWETDAALQASDVQMFQTALDQVQASQGILVALRGTDAAAKDAMAADKRLECWAESRLVVEVGEAFVKDALSAQSAEPASAPASPHAAIAAEAPAAAQPRRFPSLVAQAASLTSSNPGAAMFMPSKPRAPAAEAAPAAKILGYAWGGAPAGTSTSAGVAQIRNGRRRPSAEEPQAVGAAPAAPAQYEDVEIITTPRKPRPEPAPAPVASAPAVHEDVEIITTPRKTHPAPAPAPVPAAPLESEEFEIITTPRKPAPSAVSPAATAAPVAEPAPAAASFESLTTSRSAPAPQPAAAPTTQGGVLTLNLTREQAMEKAQVRPGAGARLALVPHVAFRYDLHMERAGMPMPVTGKGVILASSVTGQLVAAEGLSFAEAAPAEARRDAEKLQAVDVYDSVKGHLVKTYGRTMSVERELAGNTIMETVKMSPSPEEMGLDHVGVVHVPVWEITTSTGVVKVDAYTGHVAQ